MHALPTLAVLTLASALAAQGLVSPAHFTQAEGNTYSYVGIGSTSTPDRVLQVHDDLKGVVRTIGSVAFRRDASLASSSYDYAAYNILCDITLSNAATTSASISTTFDLNHGANKTQVASFKLAAFPATKHKRGSEPFDYKILFTTPYAFDGSTGLCFEIKVNSKTNTQTVYLDYQSTTVSTNPYAYDEYTGTGCKATGYTSPMFVQGNSNPNWPANSLTLGWTGSSLPKNALGYLCLGASDQTWSSLTLPFALPGTSSAPSGTCTVYCDWSVQIPALSNATGGLTQNIGFQANPNWNGQSIYSQLVFLDAAANSWGAVMTNRVQHQVIAPYTLLPVSICYAQGGLPVTGTVAKNQAYPIKFE